MSDGPGKVLRPLLRLDRLDSPDSAGASQFKKAFHRYNDGVDAKPFNRPPALAQNSAPLPPETIGATFEPRARSLPMCEVPPAPGAGAAEPVVTRYDHVKVDASGSGKVTAGVEVGAEVEYLVEYLDNGEVLITRGAGVSAAESFGGVVGVRLDTGENQYGHFSAAEFKLTAAVNGGQTARLDSKDEIGTYIAADATNVLPGGNGLRQGAGAAYEQADRWTPGFLDRPAGWLLGGVDAVTPGDLRGARDATVEYLNYDLPEPETVYGEGSYAQGGRLELLRPQSSDPGSILEPGASAGASGSMELTVGASRDTRTGETTQYVSTSVEGAANFESSIIEPLLAEAATANAPFLAPAAQQLIEPLDIPGRLEQLGVPEQLGPVRAGTGATIAQTLDAEGRPVALDVTSEYFYNDQRVVANTHYDLLTGTKQQSEQRYEVQSEDYGLEGGIGVADAGFSVTVESATLVESK